MVFKASDMGIHFPSGGPRCLGCLRWGLFLLLLHVYGFPSSWGESRVSVHNQISTVPALYDVTSSLHVAMVSVLPGFGLFSELFTQM